MNRIFLIAVLALASICSWAVAEQPIPSPPQPRPSLDLPKTVNGGSGSFIVVKPTTFVGDDISWQSVDDGLTFLPGELLANKSTLVVVGQTGRYRIRGIAAGVVDGKAVLSQVAESVIVIGDAPAIVKPDAINEKPSPRSILIVHETAQDTPKFSNAITLLRSGEQADYLKSAGHKVSILDEDSKGPDHKPSKAVQEWAPHLSGMKLPAIFILDSEGKKLLHKQELLPDSSVQQIIDIIKAND